MARGKVLPAAAEEDDVVAPAAGALVPPAPAESSDEECTEKAPKAKVDVSVLGVQSEQHTEAMVRKMPALAAYDPNSRVTFDTDDSDDDSAGGEEQEAEPPGCSERCAMRRHNCKVATKSCLRKTVYYLCFVWALLWAKQHLEYLFVDIMYGPLRTKAELLYESVSDHLHRLRRKLPDFIQRALDEETGCYATVRNWLRDDVLGCFCWAGRACKNWMRESQYQNSGG